MKRLVILGAIWALVAAKPGLYKEKEDFQFSRSSSDDGTKSGFYGAQRGNMGGNYERAHNMDSLAQNQMGGLVRQVEGELGDGARQRTGSVYTAANSRGTYGSGRFDLSNLGGRNFQEGTSYGDAQSQSSHSASSAYNAAGYTNSQSQNSRHSGYQATGYSGLATGYSGLGTEQSGLATGHSALNLQSDHLQALDHTQGAGQYDYGRQTSHAAGYNAQSGYQQHAAYDTSNTNLHSGGYGSNVQTRLISATPVRIIVRPGTRVAIPVAAQTYDLTHGSSFIDQNSLNSEAEVLSNDNQRTVYRPGNAKHYESSYNYRKEWEKHDTIPATVISPTSTDNPFPKNSELYEDRQAHTANGQYDTRREDSQRTHSAYGGYNANVKSTSGQSRFNYDTQRNGASLTNANAYSVAGYGANHAETSSDSSLNANAYNIQSQYDAGRYHGVSSDALRQAAGQHNTAADLNSQVENLSSKPKSYQSAYSYHKSWERQGDPYVIKPASGAYNDGQSSSQRLTTGSAQNLGYSSTGSHYQHSHASGADCDENGHIRVARSYNTDQFQETQQQSQNFEDFGQQQQSQNLEDFGQQQQAQNLEDFGQQQQSQNLEDFGQQQQAQNLEDFGQQQQSQNLEDFGQQQQKQNLDDLGQQVENVGQQAEVVWDSQSEQEGGQQANIDHTWDKFEDVGQKPQDIEKQLPNVEQNNQNGHGPRTQGTETEQKNIREDQQTQDKRSFNQQSQDNQQNINTQDKDDEQSNKFNQQETQPQLSDDDTFNFFQQSQKHNNDQMSVWDKFDIGSNQNTEQNKYNSEHTNSNGNKVNWSLVTQQTGLDQQSNSGSKPDKPQSVQHNKNNGSTVEQITSNIQQSHNIPGTNEQSNPGYFNLHNEQVNTHTNQNQFRNEENSFQETHKLQQSSGWYWSNNHRQEQTTNTDSYYNANGFDTISSNTEPLSSLWNKLNNFEQTLLPDNVDKGAGNSFSQVQTSTQNSYGNSMHAYNNMESTSQDHLNSQNMKPYQDLLHFIEKDTTQNKSDLSRVTEKDTNQNKSNETKREKESSFDLGRGDIGPEDLSDLAPVSSETIQNRDENSKKNNTNAQHYNQDVQLHETTQGQTNTHQHHDFQEQQDVQNREQLNPHVFSLHENIDHTQDSKKQHNLEQHNVQHYEESSEQKDAQAFDQQDNVEQINLHEFEKQDNMEQQNLHDFGNESNLEQQNLHDFGKRDNLEQQNTHDFRQQVNLEQQNSHDFGHQVNLEQQNLHDFGKQDNSEQLNLQDFMQQVNMDQQNLHDFGKQDNFEQQNLQDFGQEVNSEQQNLHDFGQQVNVDQKQDNLEQQNLQDFGQQINVDQPNLHDFGKQDNLEQQNLQDFGQQVNVDQPNLHDFGKRDNLEQQNLQDFGQQVNVDQPNLHDFGKQDNLEQQNLQDFGQQVNVDQPNLHDFGKQDNLEQQNLQDFGQQVNLEQQNVHDFGQQETLEQQNSKDFGKQDNLEQQNLQDFGQQAYLDQHNLEHFGSQDNLQQQNKNQEQFIEDMEQSLKYSKEERTGLQINNEQSQTYLPPPPEVIEQPIVKKQNNDLLSVSAQTPSTEVSPIEPVTEPTGFWKSVGSKLSRAKSKIASWF